MTLKAIVDEVPQGLADYYTKGDDGRYYLQVESVDGWELDDISGLRTALGALKGERQTLRDRLATFDGLDADAARAALTDVERLREIDPEKEADRLAEEKYKAAMKQLGDKHSAALTKADERAQALTAIVDDVVRKQAITAALAEQKGSVDLLLPMLLARTKTIERDGKFSAVVMDDYGNPVVDKDGSDLPISGYVAQLRQDERYGRAFDATGTTGTGMGHHGSAGSAGLKRSAMSAQEKLEYLQKHGQESYMQLSE